MKQRGIVRHDTAGTVLQRSLEVIFGIANPEIGHNTSFAKVVAEESHQRVEQFECFEKEMNFPVVSPLSDFPFIGLLRPKGHLHGMLLDIDIGQQAKEHGDEVEEELFISHEGHDLWVNLAQSILMFIPYPKYGNMLPFVSSDHFGDLLHCCGAGSFQLYVHWDPWKQCKDFLQGRDPLSFRTNRHSKRCEIQLNLFFESWQIIKVQVSYKGLYTAGSLEVVVVMDDKHPIFCLADIHFEHITVSNCFSKGFNSVFCPDAWSAPMGNFQHPLSKESFHKNQGFWISMRFVEEGREEEKSPAHEQISTKHQHQRYQDHRMVFIKQRVRLKMPLLYRDQRTVLLKVSVLSDNSRKTQQISRILNMSTYCMDNIRYFPQLQRQSAIFWLLRNEQMLGAFPDIYCCQDIERQIKNLDCQKRIEKSWIFVGRTGRYFHLEGERDKKWYL